MHAGLDEGGLPTAVVWKESVYPWGPEAEQLVIAERTASVKDPAQHAAAPAQAEHPAADPGSD